MYWFYLYKRDTGWFSARRLDYFRLCLNIRSRAPIHFVFQSYSKTLSYYGKIISRLSNLRYKYARCVNGYQILSIEKYVRNYFQTESNSWLYYNASSWSLRCFTQISFHQIFDRTLQYTRKLAKCFCACFVNIPAFCFICLDRTNIDFWQVSKLALCEQRLSS